MLSGPDVLAYLKQIWEKFYFKINPKSASNTSPPLSKKVCRQYSSQTGYWKGSSDVGIAKEKS